MLLFLYENIIVDTGFWIHMVAHFAIPAAVAWLFYRPVFTRAFLIMAAGILIDADHILASPVLDPYRCSVGFHLLHSYWLIPVYLALAVYQKTRLIGLGLLIHLAVDQLDCIF
ncbi:MAG: DUF6122 family protein [Hymenobacteraceae bacterium]|nr:DUF6122 family protein [Hymenobacteraceae bacterium]MDX5394664.1 DUF6122 family protein [Hymenobacteraceae bacterium]MDX5510695.1 DUF6122 family protein [Hymenobacteraceae bacterium]